MTPWFHHIANSTGLPAEASSGVTGPVKYIMLTPGASSHFRLTVFGR